MPMRMSGHRFQQLAELVVRDVARPDGERDGPGEDQEDAPAEEAASDVHGPNRTRVGAPMQRPNVTKCA